MCGLNLMVLKLRVEVEVFSFSLIDDVSTFKRFTVSRLIVFDYFLIFLCS